MLTKSELHRASDFCLFHIQKLKVGSQESLSSTMWLHGRSMADGEITASGLFKIQAAILTDSCLATRHLTKKKTLYWFYFLVSSSFWSCSSRRNFCTFPITVLSKSLTNRMYRGTLYSATCNKHRHNRHT